MELIRVVAYCRVSTSSKDQLNSFENQQGYFKREISKKSDMELVETYADKGLSGITIGKRKEFLRMLYDAGVDWSIVKGKVLLTQSDRQPKFKRILVSNTSRFARNILAIDALRELKRKGVYIDFLDSGKSSENETDEVFIQMLISFAEQESRDKSIKVRFGQKESSMNGVIFTNKSIFGYLYTPKTNELEIIPEEAEIIRTIFELYSSGEGIRRIIDILDMKGMKTRDKKSFAKSTISKILGNEKYCGTLVRNRLSTGVDFLNKLSSHKIKPKDEWIVHENRIPAIVTKELFEKVQEIRDGKIHTKIQRGINKGNSEFAGYIRCGQCGNSYIKNADRGRPFYNCSLKKTKGIVHCDNPNLPLRKLDEIMKILQNGGLHETFLLDRDDKVSDLIEVKDKLMMRIDQEKTSEVNKLQNNLQIKMEQKSRLAILFIEGAFDKDQLDRMRHDIDRDISALQRQIYDLSKNNQDIIREAREIDTHINHLKSLEIKQIHSREEVLSQLKAIIVNKNSDDSKKTETVLEFKIFDLINRITENYLKFDQVEIKAQKLNAIYNEGILLKQT